MHQQVQIKESAVKKIRQRKNMFRRGEKAKCDLAQPVGCTGQVGTGKAQGTIRKCDGVCTVVLIC